MLANPKVCFLVLSMACVAKECTANATAKNEGDADVVIVGAGVSGICAAIEAGEAGLNVQVVDMWSVFGGHAVMSSGKISIVGSPFQEAEGIEDSVELAANDFHALGEVADPEWVRMYTTRSREWVFDWLASKGVVWAGLDRLQPEGNSVRRLHEISGRGTGLVAPLFRACARLDNVRFRWNEKAVQLIDEDGRIVGVQLENMRNEKQSALRSKFVVIATGGFQNNLELVRKNWPGVQNDARILQGAGVNAVGSGLELASERGAHIQHLDRQWNYRRGLPHPYDKTGQKGLGVWVPGAISVDAQGRRFMNEQAGPKHSIPIVARQPGGGYFEVFDKDGREILFVSGSGWEDESRIQKEIFENRRLAPYVKQAPTIEGLAGKMGVAPKALQETVDRWNGFVDEREDKDFGSQILPEFDRYLRKSTPPFFALKLFPMTRKSFGGIAVDTACQVIDENGSVIPRLFAVGEVTGFAGVNGRAGLEGTMLGPSVLMGRIAGQKIAEELGAKGNKISKSHVPFSEEFAASDPVALRSAQAWLRVMIGTPREGYLHFERAHAEVLAKKLDCRSCHHGQVAMTLQSETLDHLAISHRCSTCHNANE